jgi:hypothetical protein
MSPGARLQDYIAVANYSDVPLSLQVYAGDALNASSGAFDILEQSQRSTDVGAWVSFRGSNGLTVTVPPHQQVNEPFSVTVPTNATPGDHSGGIVASLASTDVTGGRRVTVDRRVGTRIYIRVPGTLSPAVSVGGLTAKYTTTVNPLGFGRVVVHYTLTNAGNVRLQGTQRLRASAGIGGGLATVVIELPVLLPGQSVPVTGQLRGVPPLGRLTVEVTIEPVATEAGAKVASTSRSQQVWGWPWPQALVLLVLAWAVVLVRHQRRLHRAQVDRAVADALDRGRREQPVGDPYD